jgi:Tfp pilus assembly PilM family ATPase
MQPNKFFRLFPPPKFLAMNHAGLDISDDSIRHLEYGSTLAGTIVEKYSHVDLKPGVFEGGEIKDESAFIAALKKFNDIAKLSYVKVSIPEEKAYLFQTEVVGNSLDEIRQNIEFKMEENVPIPVSEALFYFDLLPMPVTGGTLRASVSVVPQSHIDKYIAVLGEVGMMPVSFELAPKAISRSVISKDDKGTYIIVHFLNKKVGFYVVSEGIVCFSSTISLASQMSVDVSKSSTGSYIDDVQKEITRIYQYWMSHGGEHPVVDKVMLVGADADKYESQLNNPVPGAALPVTVANVWVNAFSVDTYVPPISHTDSLAFAVSAGLAMPLINS